MRKFLYLLAVVLLASVFYQPSSVGRIHVVPFVEGMMRIEMRDVFGEDFEIPAWVKRCLTAGV